MKVCFVWAEKTGTPSDREYGLADDFLAGVLRHGDEVEKVTKGSANKIGTDADAVCMVGVKSLKLFREMRREGKHVIYFDKGYFRHRAVGSRVWEYWRVAVNDHHPTDYIAKAKHGPLRWQQLAKHRHVVLAPWRSQGDTVIFAGSSEKYHAFCGLPGPTEYAEGVIEQLKKLTTKKIIYRPKPTWDEATPIKGTEFSRRETSIEQVMPASWCLVTNGSNASFDALIAGVPSIVLGNAITKPLFSHDLKDIANPKIPSDEQRDQWLANLAWCMFTGEEMREGLAWDAIRPQLNGEILDDSKVPQVAWTGERPTKAILKRTGQWHKQRIKRTKEQQRQQKPFTKVKVSEAPDEWDV